MHWVSPVQNGALHGAKGQRAARRYGPALTFCGRALQKRESALTKKGLAYLFTDNFIRKKKCRRH